MALHIQGKFEKSRPIQEKYLRLLLNNQKVLYKYLPKDSKSPSMEVRSKYGNKSLRVLGVHIWNPLTDNIEYETSMNIFKGYIKTWFGPKCKCYLFAN